MIIRHQRITIIKASRPRSNNINDELQWFGSSLGLFSLRDKDKSSFRIFIELLKSAKKDNGITSDELAFRLGLTRGTVVHHLRKLIDSGIVIPERKRYILRVSSLQSLIDELERDMKQACDDLKTVARDIDEKLR
jgi:predicted transcriptional regulator